MGGYGRYDDDRKASEAVAATVRQRQVAVMPERRGPGWVWTWAADADADTGKCTMAAVLLSFEQRRMLAQRGLADRPLEAVLRCKWVDVKITFGGSERPSPQPGFDMVSVVQTAKPEGKVHFECHQMFGFAIKDHKPAEGSSGGEAAVLLFERARYLKAAHAMGADRVRQAWEGLPLATARDTHCVVEPGLSGNADVMCSMLFETDDPVVCASAGLVGFTRRAFSDNVGGRTYGPKNGLAVAFRCKEGHHGLVRSVGADALEMAFYRADDQTPSWTQRAPLDSVIPGVATSAAVESHKDLLLKGSTPAGRAAESRIAWFGANLDFVGAWFGAAPKDVAWLGSVDFARILSDVAPTLQCDPVQKGSRAPMVCRANPAVDLGPIACAAVAWGLAGALPHVAKPLFPKRADVDLEVGCGPTMGRGESLLVQRRPAPNARIAMTVAAPAFKAISDSSGNDDCEEAFLGMDCDDTEPVSPDPAWPARVFFLEAPDDPASAAALKPAKR
jgi:hypothetical protein